MEDQELIEQGTQAEMLLGNDAFTKTVNGLLDQYVSLFFSTDPLQKDEREVAYHSARAMQEIVNTLNQKVMMKNQILSAKE
jgi:hypothetical protein